MSAGSPDLPEPKSVHLARERDDFCLPGRPSGVRLHPLARAVPRSPTVAAHAASGTRPAATRTATTPATNRPSSAGDRAQSPLTSTTARPKMAASTCRARRASTRRPAGSVGPGSTAAHRPRRAVTPANRSPADRGYGPTVLCGSRKQSPRGRAGLSAKA